MFAVFDGLFDALLKRGDAGEATSLFADDEVVLWHTYSGFEPVD